MEKGQEREAQRQEIHLILLPGFNYRELPMNCTQLNQTASKLVTISQVSAERSHQPNGRRLTRTEKRGEIERLAEVLVLESLEISRLVSRTGSTRAAEIS